MASFSVDSLPTHLPVNSFIDEEQFPKEFYSLIPVGEKSLAL